MKKTSMVGIFILESVANVGMKDVRVTDILMLNQLKYVCIQDLVLINLYQGQSGTIKELKIFITK